MKKYLAILLLASFTMWSAVKWYEGLQVMESLVVGQDKLATQAPRRLASVLPVALPMVQRYQPITAVALGDSPEQLAQNFVAERKSSWGVEPYHELRATTYSNPLGSTVKYSVYQDGLPVVGMEISVEVKNDHSVAVGENSYRGVPKVDTHGPVVNAMDILSRVSSQYKLDDRSTNGISRVLYLAPGASEPELAFVIPLKPKEGGSPEQVVFRASDGQMLANQFSRSEF